jgi:signal transduction histidine kinase/CheY-like chemotaxis protein/HPt (histidine-containing phosphotransfer) domain-containing protein
MVAQAAGETLVENKTPLMSRFVIFSTVLFLILFIAGSVAFVLSMQLIIRANKGNDLIKLLEIERVKLETSVDKEISIVLKMARSPLIRRYFADPSTELKALAFEEIDAYSAAFAHSKIFWVNDIDKIFYSDGSEPFLLDPEKPENYWYNMTLYKTELYNFNINYNPDIKATNLWINAPVFDKNGKPLGMAGTGIELSKFVNKIYEGYEREANLYFFNANGEITGAKNVELVSAKKNIEEELSKVDFGIIAGAKNLKPGEVKVLDIPLGRVALGTVPLLEWYSIAVITDNMSDYKTPMTGLFLVTIVVIAIIFVIFNIFIFRLLKPLRKTMNDLIAASKAKSEFLAKMSHEIRTPMNAITGMAELAMREDTLESAKKHVFTIKQAGANLLSIINDILDISKIESGKMELIPTDYMFSSLVNDAVSITRMKILDSKLNFVVNIDSNIPNALRGDETRIRQILLNILSNAAKYTKRGFVSFSVNGKITDDNTVLLTIDVTDSGKGIKPEDIEKLFGEFTQVDMAANKGIEGTGLGLAITRNLVKSMGGNIKVNSEYGKGSTFTIELPQKIRSSEPLATVENPKEKNTLVYEQNEIYANSIVCAVDNLGVECERVENDEDLRKRLKNKNYSFIFASKFLLGNVIRAVEEFKSNAQIVLLAEFGDSSADENLSVLAMPAQSISIANILNGISDNYSYSTNENATTRFTAPGVKVLVVDDISTNLKVAEGLMAPYKMAVDLCQSGIDAIEAIKETRYDLVFMDHMMPEMDGIEATKIIRELGYNDLPIIALTANAVSGVKEMFLANGFNDFLSKPIETVKLNSILAKWIPREKREKKSGNEEKIADESGAVAEIKIEGIDVKKGVKTTGGTLNLYMQTLAIFHKDGVQKIGEIKRSLETDNYALYATYVHALKSASANIGANDLSESAKALEMAGKQKDADFIALNNTKFLASLETLLSDIGRVLASNRGQQNPVDLELLRSELNLLEEALVALDFNAINKSCDYLQKFSQADEVGGIVEKILQCVLIGEYEEAVAMIKRF